MSSSVTVPIACTPVPVAPPVPRNWMPIRAPVDAVALPTRSQIGERGIAVVLEELHVARAAAAVEAVVGEVQAGQLHVLDRQARDGIAEDGDRIEVEARERALPDNQLGKVGRAVDADAGSRPGRPGRRNSKFSIRTVSIVAKTAAIDRDQVAPGRRLPVRWSPPRRAR